MIDNFVFKNADISLEKLVSYLRSDWGARTDVIGFKPDSSSAEAFRRKCIDAPKFGFGNKRVDKYAWRIAKSFTDAVKKALVHPLHKPELERLKTDYDTDVVPFKMLITPGVGTFEQYVFGGVFAGATADGRRSSQPIASDLAASPYPQDLSLPDRPPEDWCDSQELDIYFPRERTASLISSMSSWNNSAFTDFSDGAPSDFNIDEDFPLDNLVKVLRHFSKGEGSNIMTITVANRKTLRDAILDPEFHNLLRVRMGGWTEYFSVLYSDHKNQHLRRPI